MLVKRKIHADCNKVTTLAFACFDMFRLPPTPHRIAMAGAAGFVGGAAAGHMLSGSRHLTNRFVSCVSAYG